MSRFAPTVSSRPRALAAFAAMAGLATAALLAQPTVASAAPPATDVPQAKIHYSFSELATDEGTRALYQRITKAAEAVCPEYDRRDLSAADVSKECQRQAVTRAIRQIGNQRLAAVHARARARHG